MNIVGKILVVLNLVLAIAAGVLIALSAALREPYKEKYNAALEDLSVIRARVDTNANITNKVVNDYKEKELLVEQLKQKMKDEEELRKVQEVRLMTQIEELNTRLTSSDVSLKETVKANERLTQEITFLNKSVTDRERMIVQLTDDVKKGRIQVISLETLANTAKSRSEQMLEQIQVLERKLAQKQEGVTPGIKTVSDPNAPNPPSVQVNGKIERVDVKDSTTLVEISLGTDQGVEKHHTLDVYRLRPEPKYLGMIRILEAQNHKSVGRLIASGNPAFRPQLRPDDLVTSKITTK